jgi:hypothetical protein
MIDSAAILIMEIGIADGSVFKNKTLEIRILSSPPELI